MLNVGSEKGRLKPNLTLELCLNCYRLPWRILLINFLHIFSSKSSIVGFYVFLAKMQRRTSNAETCGRRNNDTKSKTTKSNIVTSWGTSDIHVFVTLILDGMIDYLSLKGINKFMAESFFNLESGLHPRNSSTKLQNVGKINSEEDKETILR